MPDAHNLVHDLAGLRVLVAEDHDTIRHLTCARLARYGALPTEAADGNAAVALAQAAQFDVILTDLRMPQLDGAEIADRVRQGGGPSALACIVAVTALETPAIAAGLWDGVIDAWLPKPLDLGRLAAVVHNRMPPTATPATAAKVDFDPETLMDLRDIDGGALLGRTLKGLANEISASRVAIDQMIDRGDMDGAGRLVHKLAGFSQFMGAHALSAALRRFETLAETGDCAALRAMRDSLGETLDATQDKANRLADQIGQVSDPVI